MAVKMSVLMKGVDRLEGKLKRRARLDDVVKAVKINGSEMVRRAKRLVPVDTGNLRRSIILVFRDGGFTAHMKAYADYASYVEYGTRYMIARSFIRASYYEQTYKFKRDMKRLMR